MNITFGTRLPFQSKLFEGFEIVFVDGCHTGDEAVHWYIRRELIQEEGDRIDMNNGWGMAM